MKLLILLYDAGFSELEEIAYIPMAELEEVDLDEEIILALRHECFIYS